MTQETKTRQIFERQVELIRGRLRQLAPDLMRELESTELALKNLSPDPNANIYSGYRLAIDAIDAYFEKYPHSAKGIIVATALVNGGWLAKDKRAKTNVLDSIRYHLKHPETKRLKLYVGEPGDPANAEIGRADWDDSYRKS
jgi:hypothetical protein